MPYTRKSKILEVWADPIGHDVLKRVLLRHGLSEHRFLRSLLARSSLARLARLENTVFVDSFVEMMNLRGDAGEQRAAAATCEKAPWWKNGVAYRIYLPSFMDSDQDGYGDLRGVLQRLPYLEKLGVDILWLSPLLCEEGGGVTDFQKVSEDFGNTSDFAELARSAHERGIKVIFDIDLAATSDRHPWFQQALQGPGECRDYYVTREGGEQDPPQTWEVGALSRSWLYYPAAGVWALRFGKENRVALNWKNPALRREISAVARYWIGLGADGLCARQAYILQPGEDKALDDQLLNVCGYEKYGYEPELHSYLAETRAEVMPPAETLLIADVPRVGTGAARLLSGDALGQYDMVLDESHLWAAQKGKIRPSAALAGLKEYFISWQADASVPWAPLLFESPNLPRLIGSVGAPPQYRALLAKLLGTWLLTMRGMPAIFQGEELGLPGIKSAEANAGNEGTWGAPLPVDIARSTMPWSAGHAYGFSGGEPWTKSSRMAEYLNVEMQLSDRNSVLAHYRALIALRKNSAALVCGAFNPVFTESRKVMCYFRVLGGEKWYIELNLTEREVARPGRIDGTQRLELSNYGQCAGTVLRPYEANIYRCE